MSTDDRHSAWETLLSAARTCEQEQAMVIAAPEDFVVRIRAMHDKLWQFAKVLLWRRWSVFLALIAVSAYVVTYFIVQEPAGPVVPRPAAPALETP